MHYAVIAAGEGSRLVKEGVTRPKPLVEVNGTPLVKRLIDIFMRCGAESVSIIINEHMPAVQQYLDTLQLPVPLNVVVKTTPSSMHSFYELSKVIPRGKFCLTTVDTIFKEDDFARYIAAFEPDERHDGMWAVTPFVDDEKPLYVEVDEQMNITGFHDRHTEGVHLVSGGIYAMTSKVFPVLEYCVDNGLSRMRNFQRALVENGFRLQAFCIDKIIDVDHAGDIAAAQRFITPSSDKTHYSTT